MTDLAPPKGLILLKTDPRRGEFPFALGGSMQLRWFEFARDATQWMTGIDRSMANTFFRPGFSPGMAAIGSLAEKTLHYQAGVWNAIDGGTTGVLRRGTSMA